MTDRLIQLNKNGLKLDRQEILLEISGLNIYSQKGKERINLIRDVGFSIKKGETFAIVGESGSGKTITTSAILGLLPNSLHIASGNIIFKGNDILSCSDKIKRRLRGKEIACVFQDYKGSFTPFISIGKQLVETICSHSQVSKKEAKALSVEWLNKVGLQGERIFNSYSFQISGGQCQRAALASAMMLKPELIIADEPTTALDVLTGELILDELKKLQKESGCSVLMISHDLRLVLKQADTIAVMRYGQILEMEPNEKLKRNPKHPYTKLLLSSRPLLSELQKNLNVYAEEVAFEK